jgi:hypothetical protein
MFLRGLDAHGVTELSRELPLGSEVGKGSSAVQIRVKGWEYLGRPPSLFLHAEYYGNKRNCSGFIGDYRRRSHMAYEERETGNLIGSDKVEGTAVYGADSQRIGSIERVMIDKISGKVAYAVLGFGGFLGIGDDHYPLPWQSLKYDTNLGGYVTGITDSELRGAPKFSDESSWNWADPSVARSVDDYYRGIPAP